MIQFDIKKLVPLFIMNDQNGYAVAKAIEAAISAMDRVVQNAIDCFLNIDTMPEWRLDEIARETDCAYDFFASVDEKRNWIKNAYKFGAILGTKAAVQRFLAGRFGYVDVTEAFEYDGDPFCFSVTIDGDVTADDWKWIRRAIEKTKNVRSFLDELQLGARFHLGMQTGGGVITSYPYNKMCGLDEI